MKLEAKLLLVGTLINDTPLLIGTGEGRWVDAEILRGYGGQPYIPGTTLMGVLRHEYDESYGHPDRDGDYFFGHADTQLSTAMQSHFVLEDALPQANQDLPVVVRDGIRIDPKTGTAVVGAKYDYELLERGCHFSLFGELTLFSFDGSQPIEKGDAFIARIMAILNRGIRVGAKTRVGLGQLRSEGLALYRFDFPRDAVQWFTYLDHGVDSLTAYIPTPAGVPSRNSLTVEADFGLRRSLMIGSYAVDPESPDKVHLQSRGDSIIPGTAIKGALRHQAERIIHTLRHPDYAFGTDQLDAVCQHFCQDLFGHVSEAADGRRQASAAASRLSVDEAIVSGEARSVQSRIRIDRFTGGVQMGALFDEQPILHDQETIHLTLSVSHPRPEEVGLTLLLLKDLWTGHLPLGGEIGIGRGLLEGRQAHLTYWHDDVAEEITIEAAAQDLHFSGLEAAELYVQKFIDAITAEEVRA